MNVDRVTGIRKIGVANAKGKGGEGVKKTLTHVREVQLYRRCYSGKIVSMKERKDWICYCAFTCKMLNGLF